MLAKETRVAREVAWLISAHETEDHFIDSPGYVAAGDVLANHNFQPGEDGGSLQNPGRSRFRGWARSIWPDTRLNRKIALKLLPRISQLTPIACADLNARRAQPQR
jgi:hypothetical protein